MSHTSLRSLESKTMYTISCYGGTLIFNSSKANSDYLGRLDTKIGPCLETTVPLALG